MWKHRKPGTLLEIERNSVKEGGKNPGSYETEVPVSGTRATDASMEHKSDLTVEKGNPISNQKLFPRPPIHSKISRPRSSATDADVMSKRPAIFSECPKQSAVHHPPFLPVPPNQQILMFGGAHSTSDNYLANNGHNHIITYGPLNAPLPMSSEINISEINISGIHPHHNGTSLVNTSHVLSYKWENSVPFRPSFPWPKPDSSVEILNDLRIDDSANSPDNADSEDMKISPENSPAAAVSNNQSGIGENSPDYNNQYNYLSKVKPKLAPLEEASNEVSSGNGPTDRTRPAQTANGELAELKAFRIALAEFIKELVKPAWKNGVLSVDAHKMVVKKASDKVVSSVQPHQMPNSPEAVKQYISMYRPKIEKLVEGYLEMYRKNGRPVNPKNEVSCIGSSS